jgi:hypothetical protein
LQQMQVESSQHLTYNKVHIGSKVPQSLVILNQMMIIYYENISRNIKFILNFLVSLFQHTNRSQSRDTSEERELTSVMINCKRPKPKSLAGFLAFG